MGWFEDKLSTLTNSPVRPPVRPSVVSSPPPPKHTISLQMSTWLINQYAVRQGLTSKLWHWDGLPPPPLPGAAVSDARPREPDAAHGLLWAERDHRLSSIIQSVVLLFTANDPDKPPNSHVLRAPRHNWHRATRPPRLRANVFHVGPAPRRPLAVRYQWYLLIRTRYLPFWSL